ncbi:MAG: hypothetical protein JOY78_05470 [Pseudonocardia sp.]|nr:hypothetical protein [Pseudonocardia sp.]
MPALDFKIDVKGAEKVEAAATKLPADGQRALTKEKKRLAKNLAAKLRRAVVSRSKTTMGSKVRPTIHQSGETVTAGPHPMLFGTEFGMNRKSGWYADERFRHSPALQYFRHQSDGYWWRPTILRSQPDADAAVQRAADDAVSHWGA